MLPKRIVRRAIVCGKWPIDFLEHEHRSGGSVFGKSYLDEIDDHLADVSANATAMCFLLESLPEKLNVVEFFGGAGIQSLIIQEKIQPSKHIIIEQDDSCMAQLIQMFRENPNIALFQVDATQLIDAMVGDLFVLDWNSWTISHWSQWQRVWSRLIERNPAGVIWFDSSWSYFHMHRERYGKILRRKITDRESYTHALSNFFDKRLGYSISRTAYCPRGTYYLMQSSVIVANLSVVEKKVYPNSGGFVWTNERDAQASKQ